MFYRRAHFSKINGKSILPNLLELDMMLRNWMEEWKRLGRILSSAKRHSRRLRWQPDPMGSLVELLEDRTLLATGIAVGNPHARVFDQQEHPFQQTDEERQNNNGRANDIIATGTDRGIGSVVRVFNAITRELRFTIDPYPGSQNGARVAVGDLNGDGMPDIITGPGPGGGSLIRAFSGTDGTTELLSGFYAFESSFAGGVFVAAGDVNGDDRADIVVGADAGGKPHVRVFSGNDGSELMNFFAFDEDFDGGVRVAAGDISGDGTADIITAAGPGGGPHVRVFDGTTSQTGGSPSTDIGGAMGSFFAFDVSFAGGVFVAAGDVSGDGRTDVITGAGAGGGPHVKVFDGTNGAVLFSFFAFDVGFTGGVRVSASDITGDGLIDILTAPGEGSGPNLRAFDAATGKLIPAAPAEASQSAVGVFNAGSVESSRSPLRLADGFLGDDSAEVLAFAQADPAFAAAVARLEAGGSSAGMTSTLSTIGVRISDLGGNRLGEAFPASILLDDDAAGIGWFVDLTPDADDEFDAETLAAVTAEARGGVGLLTVLFHEIGHQLGLSDFDGGIHPNNFMAETLTPAQRRLPRQEDFDQLFVPGDDLDELLDA